MNYENDLISSYKLQQVHADDLKHQVVKFCDWYFMKLCLMFGVRSSPGVFCTLLALFVNCIMLMVGMARFLMEQHLDDVLAISSVSASDPVVAFH